MKEVEKLTEEIKKHDKNYWEDNNPTISDSDYDQLINDLKKMDPSNELISKVHGSTGGKITHKKPMLSLDKAYSKEEIVDWCRKRERSRDEMFIIQPKYDGISANYEDGILSTRGDGSVGEDITDKLPLVEFACCTPFDGGVRGEIVITDEDFENIYSNVKRKGGGVYKNSRNAVAGVMNLKDISSVKAQGARVTFVPFDMHSIEGTTAKIWKDFDKAVTRAKKLGYPMDGLVIKLKDTEYSESLGNTSHHPRGQIAFKFSNQKAKTKLLDIEWSFGKNNLTPVGILDPVDIGGVTISRVSLHNLDNIKGRDIMVNDIVTIERAGDVIPYVSDVEKGEYRFSQIPTKCPSCGECLIFGTEVVCENDSCGELVLNRILDGIKKFDIENLGEPTLRKMIDKLHVSSLADIFLLSVEDILTLDGFKEKSANKIISEIKKNNKKEDYKILASLNLASIGRTVGKTVLTHYTIEELLSVSESDLTKIEGVGGVIAESIVCGLKDKEVLLSDILKQVDPIQTKGSADSDADKVTICFTGKMPEKRSYYEAIAIERGMKPEKSVKKGLGLLIVNDINSGSSKIKKAIKMGIEIKELNSWL